MSKFNSEIIPIRSLEHLIKDLDYAFQTHDEKLLPFIGKMPTLSNFQTQINTKSFTSEKRIKLNKIITQQYKNCGIDTLEQPNLEKILELNTFFVTTAHQPNLMTGPSYFFYKIISTIKLAQLIKNENQNSHIIPCYVIGSEDHDFEELGHFYLLGNRIELTQNRGIAFAKYPIEDLIPVVEKIKNILPPSTNTSNLVTLLENCIRQTKTIGEFTMLFIHEIFGKYGLVIIDMAGREAKQAFAPIMMEELTKSSSYPLVQNTILKKQSQNLGAQAFPREINLFYHGKNGRTRIEKVSDGWQTIDKTHQWNASQLEDELAKTPENFSPNVILRPLIQELILPNIAYVGGPGEMAYWMERMDQFNHYQIEFPILVRRDSFFILSEKLFKKWQKLGLPLRELFKSKEDLIKKINEDNFDQTIMVDFRRDIINALDQLVQKSQAIDDPLRQSMEAEKARWIKNIDNVESKISKAMKIKNDAFIQSGLQVQGTLFPNGNWQERTESFLGFIAQCGFELIDYLIQEANPLQSEIKLILTKDVANDYL
ncbi:MAG: bacillithiol biosynthesis cysteine-adding enzyme BshC [Saprospiraceae bacterium]|nr:bacillithiol biosynthesis cysteine-adding enzyme BshC [Saprospiraceae bacterium]